jgi:hypothetical protein
MSSQASVLPSKSIDTSLFRITGALGTHQHTVILELGTHGSPSYGVFSSWLLPLVLFFLLLPGFSHLTCYLCCHCCISHLRNTAVGQRLAPSCAMATGHIMAILLYRGLWPWTLHPPQRVSDAHCCATHGGTVYTETV